MRIPAPSPAMVVAVTALVVGCAGTSYAALELPRDSVGTEQLKDGAVATRKIKDSAVTARKIEERAVGTDELQDRSSCTA